MRAILAFGFVSAVLGGFNGMARTPPMGWRSWNELGCNVSQPDIIAAARGLADTSRLVNGTATSLLQLGYRYVDSCDRTS